MKDTGISTVCRCNRLSGEETLHPLASIIDLRKACGCGRLKLDCYAVMLAEGLPADCHGGQQGCDYSDAAMLFATPGNSIEAVEAADGRLLLFHPDLMRCEGLGCKIAGYTFFGYDGCERLWLSRRGMRQIQLCMDYIDEELHWGIDRFSCTLLCNKIELLLNYCSRFYGIQFILRHDLSEEVMAEVSRRADSYFMQGRAASEGMPTAALIARWAGHSEAYTADMVRQETGLEPAEFVAMRRLAVAKELLLGTPKATSEIAALLGFACESSFCRLFSRLTGCTPAEYRHS